MDQEQLQQFQRMVEADPDNELGQFSLGRGLVEMKEYAQAIEHLRKVIELNPHHSKAYQLLGLAQKSVGDEQGALATLRQGFEVANARGDIMPRDGIARLLRQLGHEPPEPSEGWHEMRAEEVGQGKILCQRCHQSAAPLAKPPFKGPLGQEIQRSTCPSCWQEWILMGTKVINELRLDLTDPQGSDLYDRHMREFLNLSP